MGAGNCTQALYKSSLDSQLLGYLFIPVIIMLVLLYLSAFLRHTSIFHEEVGLYLISQMRKLRNNKAKETVQDHRAGIKRRQDL